MTLSSNWKVKIFTTSLIKSWWHEFLSPIDLKGIKKFNYCIRKNILALKAREAAKWPRTFYMVLTVYIFVHVARGGMTSCQAQLNLFFSYLMIRQKNLQT